MIQVTSREFRSNQSSLFAKADAGEQVVIRRRGKQSYLLLPISDDDFTISPELAVRIAKAREDSRAGKLPGFDNKEDMHAWLESL